MIEVYNETGGNIISVEETTPEDVPTKGIVDPGDARGGGFVINGMVEKPPLEEAPSNLMINGRYILQPEIFNLLENQETGAGGEIQITDAMERLAKVQDFFGFKFTGNTFDCGLTEGFIAANVAFSLAREDIAVNVRPEIERLLAEPG